MFVSTSILYSVRDMQCHVYTTDAYLFLYLSIYIYTYGWYAISCTSPTAHHMNILYTPTLSVIHEQYIAAGNEINKPSHTQTCRKSRKTPKVLFLKTS